jgi:hypothetical protein
VTAFKRTIESETTMTITRRSFLKLGGGLLIAVSGGVVYRAVDQGVFSVQQGPAYQPWATWRASANPLERIVAAAILAANPHNSQPWYFRIGDRAIDLFADYSRQIGTIDPLRREMHQGLGCAVENMALAARAEGFREQQPAARLRILVVHRRPRRHIDLSALWSRAFWVAGSSLPRRLRAITASVAAAGGRWLGIVFLTASWMRMWCLTMPITRDISKYVFTYYAFSAYLKHLAIRRCMSAQVLSGIITEATISSSTGHTRFLWGSSTWVTCAATRFRNVMLWG